MDRDETPVLRLRRDFTADLPPSKDERIQAVSSHVDQLEAGYRDIGRLLSALWRSLGDGGVPPDLAAGIVMSACGPTYNRVTEQIDKALRPS